MCHIATVSSPSWTIISDRNPKLIKEGGLTGSAAQILCVVQEPLNLLPCKKRQGTSFVNITQVFSISTFCCCLPNRERVGCSLKRVEVEYKETEETAQVRVKLWKVNTLHNKWHSSPKRCALLKNIGLFNIHSNMPITPNRKAWGDEASFYTTWYVQLFIRTEMSIRTKKKLERGMALCDFWLSPLATTLSLLLDTLPGCPLARRLFKPPPPLHPEGHKTSHVGVRRPDWCVFGQMLLGTSVIRIWREMFLFLKQWIQRWRTEERGFLEEVSKISVVFDGSQLKRLFPAVWHS